MQSDVLGHWLIKSKVSYSKGIEMGLDRVRQVRDNMRLVPKCPIVLVGGTNGKGSVCAILESIYSESGYSVGTYTSPHIHRFNERVKISRQEVSDEQLIDSFERIGNSTKGILLTYFEYATLAAIDCFSKVDLDVILLEVGLGGRLDAVNAFDGDCSVITSLGVDHKEFLGSTLDEIAIEKAGIFRKHRPVVCGQENPPLALEKAAKDKEVNLNLMGRDFGFKVENNRQWQFWIKNKQKISLPWPSLKGDVQLNNAAVSLAVLDALKSVVPVDLGSIRKGLVSVVLEGRFQVLPTKPQIILDVCHNPHASQSLSMNLSQMPKVKKTVAIFGILSNKDAIGVIEAIKLNIDYWIITPLRTEKNMSPIDLRLAFSQCGISDNKLRAASSINDSFEIVRDLTSDSDRILVFGSFFLVADTMNFIKGF